MSKKSNCFDLMKFIVSDALGKARCEPGWNWAPAPLEDFDLWYAASGTGEMSINGIKYPISKGSCFLIRPGDIPKATQNLDDRLLVIFIHFNRVSICDPQETSLCELPPRHTKLSDPFYVESLLNRILEIHELRDEWRDMECDSLMKQLCIQLLRSQHSGLKEGEISQKQKQLIGRVTGHIRQEVGKRIVHQQLADMVQLSPQYLSKLFKKCVGISIKEYITQERTKRAMYLLSETSMNVSQVAEALGYANVYLFSKQFKQHFGEPPSRFLMKSVASKSHS